MTRRVAFTQGDLSRAVRGARAAGMEVAEVRILGSEIIIRAKTSGDDGTADPDGLDAELKRFEQNHGHR